MIVNIDLNKELIKLIYNAGDTYQEAINHYNLLLSKYPTYKIEEVNKSIISSSNSNNGGGGCGCGGKIKAQEEKIKDLEKTIDKLSKTIDDLNIRVSHISIGNPVWIYYPEKFTYPSYPTYQPYVSYTSTFGVENNETTATNVKVCTSKTI